MNKKNTIEVSIIIGREKEGSYFELPFETPQNVQRIDIRYKYERRRSVTLKGGISKEEVNIIDLALSSNSGEFIGASGSDREHIWVSEFDSSDGYAPVRTEAGMWNIIIGAYKVHKNGVKVTYEITFELKERMLLKGDCHAHTTSSDGILSVEEITNLAKSSHLDFLFITDHNNYSHNRVIKSSESLTVIPGVEWTHFKGHANMLGVERAFRGKYYANTIDGVNEILEEARKSGAVISINHPFDSGCPWKWGLENVEYDCVEIWNGTIKQSDMKAIKWWHKELCRGRRIPVIGGSDFHKFENFSMLGHPTTCVYSMSRGRTDILTAIREGHAFAVFQPEAPTADIRCNDASMGDEIPFREGLDVSFQFSSLKKGDIIKIYSSSGIEREFTALEEDVSFDIQAKNRLFYRVEVYRQSLPSLPPILCLITNPIYFSFQK